MAKIIKTTFQLRRGTSEAWNRVNPVLAYGEPGFEKDTNKLKIGDGVKAWQSLPYYSGAYEVQIDGKSVIFNQNKLELNGYANAVVGQIPQKSADGLDWVDKPQALTLEDLQEIFNERKGE